MNTIKETLRENLLALAKLEAGGELPDREKGISIIANKAGKLPSWAQRLMGETDTRLSGVAEAAAAFGLQSWQLLVPGLDPSKPPGLSDDPAWPIPYVNRQRYLALPADDRVYCQAKMQAAIEEREAVRTGNRVTP